eukprot:scaffold49588_cov46-Phaeocystis_antarctica.AAC.3
MIRRCATLTSSACMQELSRPPALLQPCPELKAMPPEILACRQGVKPAASTASDKEGISAS